MRAQTTTSPGWAIALPEPAFRPTSEGEPATSLSWVSRYAALRFATRRTGFLPALARVAGFAFFAVTFFATAFFAVGNLITLAVFLVVVFLAVFLVTFLATGFFATLAVTFFLAAVDVLAVLRAVVAVAFFTVRRLVAVVVDALRVVAFPDVALRTGDLRAVVLRAVDVLVDFLRAVVLRAAGFLAFVADVLVFLAIAIFSLHVFR